jgi:hypothetical protein
MNRRLLYGLWLLLLVTGGNVCLSAQKVDDVATLETTATDMPQWQDIGMADLLVVTSQPTVTAPTTMRVVHEGGSMLHRSASTAKSLARLGSAIQPEYRYRRSGYIHLIVCLRL